MNLLTSLEEEHRLIVRVLAAFEGYLDSCERGSNVDSHELMRFMVFLSDFADGWHHAREEDVLLPAMTRHGYAKSSGVLMHIREQHKRERDLFFRLKRAVADNGKSPVDQLGTFLTVARDVIGFERAHIQKETDLFYPAAAKELACDDTASIEGDLLWFAETHAPRDHVKWLEQLGAELVAAHSAS